MKHRDLRAIAVAVGVSCALITAGGASATTEPHAQTVKVALLQGEQIVYADRPGSTLAQALNGLLFGPTSAERKREITTQVPAGTPLRGVSVQGRVATVDLGEKFATGTRAESLTARVAQVVLTVTRFPNIRSVRLLVKGGTPLGLFPGYITRYPLTAKSIAAPSLPPPSPSAPPSSDAESDDTRILQQRLAGLGFLPGDAVDGKAGPRTTSAVVAFQKWAGLQRDGVTGPTTRAALDAAVRPTPIALGTGKRIELLLDRQVALVIDGAAVTRTLDVSSGKPGFETPVGSWKVQRKEQRSWSVPYKVWLPWASYFVGGVAFHEYPEVPPTPASHGCVRVRSWDAQRLYQQTPVGTPVTVIARSQ